MFGARDGHWIPSIPAPVLSTPTAPGDGDPPPNPTNRFQLGKPVNGKEVAKGVVPRLYPRILTQLCPGTLSRLCPRPFELFAAPPYHSDILSKSLIGDLGLHMLHILHGPR